MSTTESMLLHAQISFEADFITPDSRLGDAFVAHMLERFIADEGTVHHSKDRPTVLNSTAFEPVEPMENQWVVSEDSDINDDWGQGLRIQTGWMHWLLGGPVAMMNLTAFIRANGITDETCRFRMSYQFPGLSGLSRFKFLFLLNELEQIRPWEKFGVFLRKSHIEHMAACIHTNLYWQDGERWFIQAHRDIENNHKYAVDFSSLRDDILHIDIVQGPHYEHRTNIIASLMHDIGDAIRFSFSEPNHPVFVDRAREFWTKHAQRADPQARFKEPST